jgi:hypothetical protein
MAFKRKNCTICGEEFQPRTTSHVRCSDECRARHYARFDIPEEITVLPQKTKAELAAIVAAWEDDAGLGWRNKKGN